MSQLDFVKPGHFLHTNCAPKWVLSGIFTFHTSWDTISIFCHAFVSEHAESSTTLCDLGLDNSGALRLELVYVICHANYTNGETFSRMSELHDNLKKLMPPDFRYKIKDIESSNNASRLRFVSSVLRQKYAISGWQISVDWICTHGVDKVRKVICFAWCFFCFKIVIGLVFVHCCRSCRSSLIPKL